MQRRRGDGQQLRAYGVEGFGGEELTESGVVVSEELGEHFDGVFAEHRWAATDGAGGGGEGDAAGFDGHGSVFGVGHGDEVVLGGELFVGEVIPEAGEVVVQARFADKSTYRYLLKFDAK